MKHVGTLIIQKNERGAIGLQGFVYRKGVFLKEIVNHPQTGEMLSEINKYRRNL